MLGVGLVTVMNLTPSLVHLQLQMTDAMDNLEELLHLSGGDGQIFTIEGPLCMKSVQAMFGYDDNCENKLYTFMFYMLRYPFAIIYFCMSTGG